MKKTFYVTTPIYYPTAKPHLGTAYTTIAADILARWHKLRGDDVFFLTGTDEHGQKLYEAAKNANMNPKDYVNKLVSDFKYVWKKLNIEFTQFVRTTDKNHEVAVKKLVKTIHKNGDLYEDEYEGLYCVPCESYWTEKDATEGKCPSCGRAVRPFKEKAYFFRLSKYQKKLLELYDKNPNFIMPESRRHEVINRVREGIKDVSFTRSKFKWGVEFPVDKKYVLWVWADALTNYISALDWPGGKKFKIYWPAEVHLIGKDILWFHSVIWPAMLLSAKIKPAKTVFAHGWWTKNGKKMSKSLNNVVDPNQIVEKYGVDTFRYFIFKETPFGEDGDFSEKALAERHNVELANKLGNLVSRLATLAEKYSLQKTENKLIKKLKLKEIERLIDNYSFDKALNLIFAFVDDCNLYIQEKKPWETKDKKVLYETADSLKAIAILLWPFIPETSEKISKQFGFEIAYSEIKKPLKARKIKVQDILFKKIDLEKAEIVEPFERLDLRVAEILEVGDVKDADRLYKLQIDVGPYGRRQIVAGIKQHYEKSELKGKKIVIVANLRPTKLKGELSEGMLLAAGKNKKVGLLVAPNSKSGDSVFPHGILPKQTRQVEFDDFLKVKIEAKGGNAFYKGKILQTIDEEIKVEKIKEHAVIK